MKDGGIDEGGADELWRENWVKSDKVYIQQRIEEKYQHENQPFNITHNIYIMKYIMSTGIYF